MTAAVVGRAAELAAIEALLDGDDGVARALVLRGEAGIGKTVLWEEGIAAASASGYLALTCRPAESEATLPFAALGDLLEPVLDDLLPDLPVPQARALDVALQRIVAGEPADQPAVHRAALGALRRLADERLLVAVDDLQWLDGPSAATLRFALRRLQGSRVRLLASLREPHRDPLELPAALARARLEQHDVGPLDASALHTVVSRRLGVSVPRPTMARIHRISAGNPFYAIELVRSLPTRNGRVDTALLELPRTLLDVVQDRLRALPEETLDLLAAAGALGEPTLPLLDALSRPADEVLQPAADAGIVRLDEQRVRFEHPLLASGSLAVLTASQRRRLHRRLAEVVPELEERALHLALGADRPSEETASLLEQAAQRAADRGAPQTAGELAEHAARLTPAETRTEAHRRRRVAAGHFLLAGEIDRGRELLRHLERELPAGPERAAALILYADTHLEMPEAVRLCEQARAEAVGDDGCLAESYRLSSEFAMLDEHLLEALALARTATSIAERAGDDVLLVRCLGTQCHFETYAGEITPGLLERAVELERQTPGTSAHYSPAQIHGLRLLASDRLHDARPVLTEILRQAEERGDEPEARNLLLHLTHLELRAGRWALAHRYSEAVYESALQLGIHSDSQLYLRALVAAHFGRVDEAREAAAGVLAPEQPTYKVWKMMAHWALGFLELSLGDRSAAARHLAPLPGQLAEAGYGNPGVRPILPDAIEALIGVGEFEEAVRWTTELRRGAQKLDNPGALAAASRCAGLIAASRGDYATARSELHDALAAHERAPNVFQRARTLLTLGALERRLKQRAAARDTLSHALDLFDSLGAPLWAEKVAAELARIPSRGPGSGELSETQRRIAELVADGLSNKEIAAQLFVTVRTVEANLTKTYEKLGVRSRTELAGALSGRRGG